MKVTECSIVGAMVPPRGNAPFDRANLVVSANDASQALGQVRTYLYADEVDVLPLHDEEWQTLVRTEQAIELPSTHLVAGAACWVLRAHFLGRDAAISELQSSGVLVHAPLRLGDGSFGCIVGEQKSEASALRNKWAFSAMGEAKKWAFDGHWERARTAATQAFVTEQAMHPETVALLALTHDKCGNATRANGYLKMAEQTHGADFAKQVRGNVTRNPLMLLTGLAS